MRPNIHDSQCGSLYIHREMIDMRLVRVNKTDQSLYIHGEMIDMHLVRVNETDQSLYIHREMIDMRLIDNSLINRLCQYL